LIVDEVHLLLAGSNREQRASLNLLKYLANDLQLCIVLVGTAFLRKCDVASLLMDPMVSSCNFYFAPFPAGHTISFRTSSFNAHKGRDRPAPGRPLMLCTTGYI
jgi:hypothetical protein